MGQAKHEMEISEDRGWYSIDKFVCAECIEDAFLKKLIQRGVESDTCDYCGRRADEDIAAPVDLLLENLADTLRYHFAEPGNAGVSYESREGGWQAKVVCTEDALFTLDFGALADDLFEDVAAAFARDEWVEAPSGHWLSVSIHDAYMQSWEAFANTVKHESRYFFGTARITSPDPDLCDPSDESPPDILSELNKLARAGLVQNIASGTTYHRARRRDSGVTWPLDAANLGAPPNERGSAGRMNPAGISYLYLADDQVTALAEVVDVAPADYAVGTFTTTRALTVLNLVDLPELPSVFDSNSREERELNLFLRGFTKAITKRVEKDGREHVSYVPSQVVSEYFRLVYETHQAQQGQPAGTLDGILYPSAARPGSRNLVLFPTGPTYKRGFDQVVFDSGEVQTVANIEAVRPTPELSWLYTNDE